jgi:hypothetical protein
MPGAIERRRWKGANVLARWRQPRFPWLRVGVAGALLLGFALPASASLGGNVNTVEADRAQMNAKVQVMPHNTYNVHRMQAPGGTEVDEYVAPDGTVFAVTWHGQFAPPMQQILGSYFQQYSEALQAQPKMYGHRPLNIQEPGLVVQTGGHMRAHYGRAYIPNMLPQGMTASQLQ